MSITIDRKDNAHDSRAEMYARDIPRGVPFTTTDDDRAQVYVRVSDVTYIVLNAEHWWKLDVVTYNPLYTFADVRCVDLRIEVTK